MLRRHHTHLARVAALLLLLLLLHPGFAAAQGVDLSQWRQGDPALEDSFSRNTGQWNIDGGSDALSYISRGRLSVQVPEEELFRWVTLDNDEAFKDFYVEIDATHIDGPTDGMMGIMFRYVDADNFYALLADAEGYFAVLAYVDGELDRLVDWTETGALNTGEGAENRLAVLASGREIVVLANDEELERVQDRSFAEGEIALIAGTNTDGELEAAFDNFSLWNKPASTPGRKSITRSTPTATAWPAADAVVTSDTLNVRSGPGTNYAIVGALKKGDGVDIVGRSKDGKWARLSLPKIREAWASAAVSRDGDRLHRDCCCGRADAPTSAQAARNQQPRVAGDRKPYRTVHHGAGQRQELPRGRQSGRQARAVSVYTPGGGTLPHRRPAAQWRLTQLGPVRRTHDG